MKSKSKNVVLFATLGALIFAAMTLDRALTPFLPLSAAFITLTVTFTFALIKPKLITGVAGGLIFGVSSCITAIFFGKEAFINPLISVLPRFFLGFIIFGVYTLTRFALKRVSEKKREIAALSVSAGLTALSNTVLVLTSMFLFGENTTLSDVFKITVFVNALPELIVTAALVPATVLAVRRALHIDVGTQTPVKAPAAAEAMSENIDAEGSSVRDCADDELKSRNALGGGEGAPSDFKEQKENGGKK